MGLIIKTLKLYFFLPQCRSIHFVSVDLFIRRDLLKKKHSLSSQNLQAQKTDNQQIKVKLRRLEEDNAKREKQIEELLDPTRVCWRCQCLGSGEKKPFANASFSPEGVRVYSQFGG